MLQFHLISSDGYTKNPTQPFSTSKNLTEAKSASLILTHIRILNNNTKKNNISQRTILCQARCSVVKCTLLCAAVDFKWSVYGRVHLRANTLEQKELK